MSHDGFPSDYDVLFSALVSACGAARIAGNLSAVRVLEAMMDADREGWMSDLAMLVERNRPTRSAADRAMATAARDWGPEECPW